jgi:hypothetical protein
VLFLTSTMAGSAVTKRLVNRSRPRRRKLDRMTGRVAEVNALPAAIPAYATLDRDAVVVEAHLR